MAELETQEVFIPEAVRRQAARAEELSAAIAAGNHPDDQPQPPPASEPPPAQTELPLPAPVYAPPAGGDWEQRYRTLQGKYDSEIPALRAQLAGMEQLLRTMQSAPAAPAATPPAQTQQPPPAVTIPQEDIDVYGPELIEANQRWTRAYIQPQLDEIRTSLEQVNGNQHQIGVQGARETVHRGLSRDPELAGVWEQLNNDQNFLAWLRQPDPFSGAVRYDLLQQAYNGGDAMRAGRFFKAYIAEHTASPPNPQPPPVPTHTGTGQPYTNGHAPAPTGGARLEDYVAPGRATGSASNGSGAPEKRTWTSQEINKFFDDRRRGKYNNRDADSQQIEADIFAAANEGRIRR